MVFTGTGFIHKPHWSLDRWQLGTKRGLFPRSTIQWEAHRGAHQEYIVIQCVKRWQLSEKLRLVLRDNGCNFVAGLRDANIPNVGCLARTLQLVVNEGVMAQRQVQDVLGCCRRIVGHFKHSNISWHALSSVQEKLGVPMHRPVQDEPTYWNSSYYMLSRISEQKQALLAVSTDVCLPCELTTCQWQVIEKVLHVHSPLKGPLRKLST